jgi:hypothetical protein
MWVEGEMESGLKEGGDRSKLAVPKATCEVSGKGGVKTRIGVDASKGTSREGAIGIESVFQIVSVQWVWRKRIALSCREAGK